MFSTTSVVYLSEVWGITVAGYSYQLCMVRRHGRLPIRQHQEHLALRDDVSVIHIIFSPLLSQLVTEMTEKMLFEGGKCIHIYQGNGR